KLWICPQHKIVKRTKQPHVIPLSTAAMAILKTMRERQIADGTVGEYVFVHGLANPRRRQQGVISFAGKKFGTGMNPFLKTILGYPNLTVHGFRSTFKSWATDNDFPDQDSERALGHIVGSPMSQLYGRDAQRLEPRRQLMQAWADYCNRVEPL